MTDMFDMFSELMAMVRARQKRSSAHLEAREEELKEKDEEIERMRKRIRMSEDENMVLRGEIKALKEVRDADIALYLEDSEDEAEEEEKEEQQTEEDEEDEDEEGDENGAETDESELTSSSYSQGMDSPQEMSDDDDDQEADSGVESVEETDSIPEPVFIEEAEYDVPVEELLGGLSPERSSSPRSPSSARSSSPASRPWTPTDSTVECREVCGATCQLKASESSTHRTSIPPILQISTDSDSSIEIIEQDE